VTSEDYQFVVTVVMKNCDPFVFLSIISYNSDFRKRNSGNRYNYLSTSLEYLEKANFFRERTWVRISLRRRRVYNRNKPQRKSQKYEMADYFKLWRTQKNTFFEQRLW
jgi:hypothetical protein